MPTTYTPLATTTLGSASATVTFSSISQAYTDLFVVMNLPAVSTDNNSDGVRFILNGDTGTNYSATWLSNSGTTPFSSRESNATRGRCSNASRTTGDIGTAFAHFQNYSNATTYKTVLGRSGNLNTNGDSNVFSVVSMWRSTSAVTSITFSLSSNGNFATGSTFSLYGIASAAVVSGAKATGGDVVATDGTYWYHTFLASGTFTPTQALTADYLVVAGGGGGWGAWQSPGGSGGGAGGLRCTVGATGGGGSLPSALSLSAQAYTVTVGAGGTAGSGDTNAGSFVAPTNGNNSVFSTITSTGGGAGGGFSAVNGSNGGSGGGEGFGGSAGGTGTANEGYAGGTNGETDNQNGAGGGGAGAVGGSPTAGNPGTAGAGGVGVATAISGTSTYYAGGGAGGTGYNNNISSGSYRASGGNGGGGAGGYNNTDSGRTYTGVAGTANTGGGGGGGGAPYQSRPILVTGGNGGSGIIIVRYPV